MKGAIVMRQKRQLTEQEKRDIERFNELMQKDSNKKLNRQITKGHVAWWLNTLGFVFFFWLIWDAFHWNKFIGNEFEVVFGMFKFCAAVILLFVAGNLSNKNT